MKAARTLICTLPLLLGLGACTPVQPWQKGYLARPDMAFDPDPSESSIRQHIYNSREAASGGYGPGGGGCGCN